MSHRCARSWFKGNVKQRNWEVSKICWGVSSAEGTSEFPDLLVASRTDPHNFSGLAGGRLESPLSPLSQSPVAPQRNNSRRRCAAQVASKKLIPTLDGREEGKLGKGGCYLSCFFPRALSRPQRHPLDIHSKSRNKRGDANGVAYMQMNERRSKSTLLIHICKRRRRIM